MFDGFDQLDGYVGAAVVSSDGELIAADGRPSDFDPAMLGFFLASALASIGRTTTASFGAIDVLRVDLAQGAVAARWVDDRKEHVAFVLLERKESTDRARYVLDVAAPSIARVISRWTERGWASPIPTPTSTGHAKSSS
jgi:predicted regulator of Ras-like GTPase activity (Roadblock/LC7/MglB family)